MGRGKGRVVMGIWQAFKMAVKSVWSNKTRSALTMLGVIIGVAAVIAAVGFAQSCMKAVSGLIEGMGSNVVTAIIVDYSSRNSIKVADLDKFGSRYVKFTKINEEEYYMEFNPSI